MAGRETAATPGPVSVVRFDDGQLVQELQRRAFQDILDVLFKLPLHPCHKSVDDESGLRECLAGPLCTQNLQRGQKSQ